MDSNAVAARRPPFRLVMPAPSHRGWRLWLAAALLLLPLGLVWPFDQSQPIIAWFPGESGKRQSIMRAVAAADDVRIVAVHRSNVLVVQSPTPGFALKLIAAGAVPVAASVYTDGICRAVGG